MATYTPTTSENPTYGTSGEADGGAGYIASAGSSGSNGSSGISIEVKGITKQ